MHVVRQPGRLNFVQEVFAISADDLSKVFQDQVVGTAPLVRQASCMVMRGFPGIDRRRCLGLEIRDGLA